MSYLLNISGWSPLSEESLVKLQEHKKLILIFPHTTSWDAFLYSLFYLKYDVIRKRAYTLINPKFGECDILKKFGFITATSVNEKNGGMVSKIIDTVKNREEYMILLSPKGSVQNKPWRSGYYYLAKELGCEILVGGFDYEKRKFVFKEPFKIENETLEEINQKCQNMMSDITPLVSERTEFELSKKKKPVYPISIWKITLFSILLLLLPLLVTVIIIFCFERKNIISKWQSNKVLGDIESTSI